MLLCYALEERNTWYILGFAGACLLGSIPAGIDLWIFAGGVAFWAGRIDLVTVGGAALVEGQRFPIGCRFLRASFVLNL